MLGCARFSIMMEFFFFDLLEDDLDFLVGGTGGNPSEVVFGATNVAAEEVAD
jgi:hypothetical protein